jgi:hypothetical protein
VSLRLEAISAFADALDEEMEAASGSDFEVLDETTDDDFDDEDGGS